MSLYYCKKCGRLIQNSWNDEKFRCDCCQTITNPVPIEFLDGKTNTFFKDKNTERQFIEELVKTSPEFDQELFAHRDEILEKQSAEFDAKMEHGRAILEEKSRSPKCTYCGSTNIKKMGLLNRAVSTELWGLGSKKIGKQFHCNNCGADF